MTTYTTKGPRPDPEIVYHGFDHITFWVGNAKQAASFYTTRFGFRPIAYAGLETGSRAWVKHVVRSNAVTFVFVSALNPGSGEGEFERFLGRHGDGVRDVAFTVGNCRAVMEEAKGRGARVVREVEVLKGEEGEVVVGTVATYGDTTHTFVERKGYKGVFLPGFGKVGDEDRDGMEEWLPKVGLDVIDHVVGNQPDDMMLPVVDFYEKVLHFHRFWSVDDSQIHTTYSSLRSIVMTDYDNVIKLPINEPALGKRKSQIQEYVDYNGGAGVQHIALHTSDIITTVTALKKRGVSFLDIPDTYYDVLATNLAQHGKSDMIKEEIAVLKALRILVDFDEGGYLLQIFTKPVQDRPTLFLEVIQRKNHQGFGAGNFKALFESIELEQAKRGNLV